MIITTARGANFDTDKPATSPIIMVLDEKGRQRKDILRITGRSTEVMEFMEPMTMVEVEHSFGIDEVSEDYLYQ